MKDVALTAGEFFDLNWKLLNVPCKGSSLSSCQLQALELLLECRGGEQSLITRPENELESLLDRLRQWSRRPLSNKTRPELTARAWATLVAFKIMRGPRYTRLTEEDRRFFWQKGRWPQPDISTA